MALESLMMSKMTPNNGRTRNVMSRSFSRPNLLIRSRSANLFVLSAIAHYGARAVVRGQAERSNARVIGEYDGPRNEVWREDITLHDLIWGNRDCVELLLLHDRLVNGTERQVRSVLLERLLTHFQRFIQPNESGTIVEFGSGTGRNLFFLAQHFPKARLLGFELTPNSVSEARARAAQAGLNVEFQQVDIRRPPPLPPETIVCFSVHALEQLGYDIQATVDAMLTAKRGAIFMEPVRELFPFNLRGLASRLRMTSSGYLGGLYPGLVERGCRIPIAGRLGIGRNPLNETCEIVVETRGNGHGHLG